MAKLTFLTFIFLVISGCGQMSLSSLMNGSEAKPFTDAVEFKPVTDAIEGNYYTREIKIPANVIPVKFSAESVDGQSEVEFSVDGVNWLPALTANANETVVVRARVVVETTAQSTIQIQVNGATNEWVLKPTLFKSFQLTQKLRQANAAVNQFERFGNAVSVSGDGSRVLIGTYTDKHPTFPEAGSATLYEKSGSTWVQLAYLQQTSPSNYEKAGEKVSLSANGQRAVIYAPNTRGPTQASGGLYLFWNNGSGWAQQQKLVMSVGEEQANSPYFGDHPQFSADGSRLVFAAPMIDGAAVDDGAVFVYDFDVATSLFVRTQKITPPDSAARYFGSHLALSGDGNTLVISRPEEIVAGGGQGVVFTYVKKVDGTYEFKSKISAPKKWALQDFGRRLSLNQNGARLIVSASEFDAENDNAGVVFTFSRDASGSWRADNELRPPSPAPTGPTLFGIRTQLDNSGTRLAVGARYGMDGSISAGLVHLYTLSDSLWTLTETISANDGLAIDYFGDGLGMSGDGKTVVVGAPEHDDENKNSTGAAYVFDERMNANVTSTTDDPRDLLPAHAGNLSLHLPFDFDLSDIGPNAHAVGMFNSVTLSATKKVGAAAGVFGASSAIYYPAVPTSSAVSISFWYYTNGAQLANTRLLESVGYRLRLGVVPTQLVFESRRGANLPVWSSDRSAIQAGRWHHIAVVYGGLVSSEPIMYLNGSPLNVTSSGPAPTGSVDTGNGLSVGGDRTLATDVSIRGSLDELTLWNAEITRQEVLNLLHHTR